MKILFVILGFSLISLCTADQAWKIYHGKWFDISVPRDFIVERNPKCSKGCDSAFFYSKARDTVLFVFSPQWIGNKNEYEYLFSLQDGEEIISDISKHEDYKTQNGKVIEENAILHRVLFIKKQNSYKRKYIIYKNSITRSVKVTGIKWSGDENIYREIFIYFDKSLKQYSD